MTSLRKSQPCTIIGGAGFVGQRLRLVMASLDDWAPKTADVSDADAICDVTSFDSVRRAIDGAEWVMNLAAVHHDNVRPISRYYDVNVQGARNVCEACRRHGIQRQVFVSSVAVYGDTQGRPADESTPHRPLNDYGRSKSQAEDVYRAWWEEDPQRHLIIVRPTVVFGERNRGNLYNLMHSLATHRFRMVGDGNVVKSIAYVENVARFIPFAVSRCPAGLHIFNYADKPDPTTAELVEVIRQELKIANQPLPRLPYWLAYAGGLVLDMLGRVSPIRSSISAQRVKKFCTATPIQTRAAEQLGYRAEVPVMEGLRRTVQSEFPC